MVVGIHRINQTSTATVSREMTSKKIKQEMDERRGLFYAMFQPVIHLCRIDQIVDLKQELEDHIKQEIELKQELKDQLKQEIENHLKQEPADHLKQEPEDHLKQEPGNYIKPEHNDHHKLDPEDHLKREPEEYKIEDNLDTKHHRAKSTVLTEQREMDERHGLFDAMFQPVVRMQRISTAYLQLSVCKEDDVVPGQQEKSSSLVQEEPETPHIKGEQAEEEIIQRPGQEAHGSAGGISNSMLPRDLKSKPQTSSIRCIQGRKIHSCTECGKIFLENSHLKIHMRFHTGEKPYTCTLCEKSFATSSHRTRHMKTHVGEKEFTCAMCGEIFGQKGSLTIHMRIHTGEKPLIDYMLTKSLGT